MRGELNERQAGACFLLSLEFAPFAPLKTRGANSVRVLIGMFYARFRVRPFRKNEFAPIAVSLETARRGRTQCEQQPKEASREHQPLARAGRASLRLVIDHGRERLRRARPYLPDVRPDALPVHTHTLQHPEYPHALETGLICAEAMTGSNAPRQAEKQARRAAARRVRQAKRVARTIAALPSRWRRQIGGVHTITLRERDSLGGTLKARAYQAHGVWHAIVWTEAEQAEGGDSYLDAADTKADLEFELARRLRKTLATPRNH